MTKIVYNDCYGGFSLSEAAVLRYAEIKGFVLYPAPFELDGRVVDLLSPVYWRVPPGPGVEYTDATGFSDLSIPRTDPALVQVVEELGAAADGTFAKLRIRDVPPGTRYRIDEYDGAESVMTVDDYEWSIA